MNSISNNLGNQIPNSFSDLEQMRKREMEKRNKKIQLVLFLFLAFYVGTAWGARNQADSTGEVSGFVRNLSNPSQILINSDKNKPKEVDFDIFWQAWKKLDQKFIDKDKLNPQQRVYGAVRGMTNALGDPYSAFMDPEETKEFNIDMEGIFEGIGAELGIKDGILTVISPIEGMPAQQAGIRAGDKIIKVDGEITADMSIDQAVKKIRGKKGTSVVLTILRVSDGDKEIKETKDISVTRDKIEIKSIAYENKGNGIAYIKIKKFSEDTSKEFALAVSKTLADRSKGLVVDVRNNPGGFLEVAVEIASEFVSKGKPIVWEEGRNGKRFSYDAIGGDDFSDIPVVVLINEGSASASEILAGALRDLRDSVLIGKKSFGKGSVQQVETLEDGSSLRITIAKWLTPDGKSIHEVGLAPDIEVEMTDEDYDKNRDPQLERALEEIRKEIDQRVQVRR